MKLIVRVRNEKKEKTSSKVIFYKLPLQSDSPVDVDKSTYYCNGELEFELEPGEYGIECYKGKLYEPVKKQVAINKSDVSVEVVLKKIIDTRSLGLYSFDAHSHVSRNLKSKSGNLASASTMMKSEDFDFFFAGSPYDLETHLQDLNNQYDAEITYREKFADTIREVNSGGGFLLDIGNEIVKCRYGHMFLMNYDQSPPFSKYYDFTWDPWLFTKIGDEPPYCIPYPYEALSKERKRNSVAAAAHPTSWWHHNGEFISNIAATLGFEILAGSIDAMVIMGYDSDHIHYQKLWYEVLNNGYFMPGIAETDHTFDSAASRRHLAFKTYSYLDDFSIDALCHSVKAGRNLVSSGPLLLLKVNGQGPGAVMSYSDNEAFEIQIEAFRCYQAPLRQIQLIVNGEVWKQYDQSGDRCDWNENIIVNKDTYILAKCYDEAGNVAITNPVYIRNSPFENRGFESELTVKVMQNGKPAEGTFRVDDAQLQTGFSDEFHSRIKVTSVVHVEVGGTVKTIKLFELEELQRIFKNLYFGYFNTDNRYVPGEVPPECFELPRIHKILKKVHIELSF